MKLFGLLRKQNGNGAGTGVPARKMIDLGKSLLSERGEVSGSHLAGAILTAYQSLEAPLRAEFFELLVSNFSPIRSKLAARPTPIEKNRQRTI